jgi:hypothetical protein
MNLKIHQWFMKDQVMFMILEIPNYEGRYVSE